ncbi:hypothetical protein MBT84_36400 [Streptomyces sp. MBT84]|nr:hypothetical protein [Streptomyces sp. MBT84]
MSPSSEASRVEAAAALASRAEVSAPPSTRMAWWIASRTSVDRPASGYRAGRVIRDRATPVLADMTMRAASSAGTRRRPCAASRSRTSRRMRIASRAASGAERRVGANISL